MTREDIQTWCDELNSWIVELGEEEEFKKAYPKDPFPLAADKDDLEDSRDVLAYLTVWMCCKRRTQAPTGLHNRMILAEPFNGPWQKLYVKLIEALEKTKEIIDIFSLAG